jgi:predicted Zn-ribbon and HTH transcriptional regulator
MGKETLRDKIKELIIVISNDEIEKAKEILKDITSDYLVMKDDDMYGKIGCCNDEDDVEDMDDENMDDVEDMDNEDNDEDIEDEEDEEDMGGESEDDEEYMDDEEDDEDMDNEEDEEDMDDEEDMEDEEDEEDEFCVICNNCGFEFEIEADELDDVKLCPKCGSDDLIIDECEK